MKLCINITINTMCCVKCFYFAKTKLNYKKIITIRK